MRDACPCGTLSVSLSTLCSLVEAPPSGVGGGGTHFTYSLWPLPALLSATMLTVSWPVDGSGGVVRPVLDDVVVGARSWKIAGVRFELRGALGVHESGVGCVCGSDSAPDSRNTNANQSTSSYFQTNAHSHVNLCYSDLRALLMNTPAGAGASVRFGSLQTWEV